MNWTVEVNLREVSRKHQPTKQSNVIGTEADSNVGGGIENQVTGGTLHAVTSSTVRQHKSLDRPKFRSVLFQSDEFNPLASAYSNQKLQIFHCAPSPIPMELQLTRSVGGFFDNFQIKLPDTTCEVSGSEVITILIETASDLNLGGGFKMVLNGAVLLLVKEVIFCLTLTRS